MELVDERIAGAAADDRDWLPLAEAAERDGCTYDAMRMRARRKRVEIRHEGRNVYVSRRSLGLR